MAIDFSDFFTKAGKAFFAAQTATTAVLTTVADEVEDFTQAFGATTPIEQLRAIEGVRVALAEWQDQLPGLLQSVAREPVRILLEELIFADNPQPSSDTLDAINELVRQMLAESETVDASTPDATPSYDAGNVGTGKFVVSIKRPDGLVNEQILGEDVVADVSSVNDATGEAAFVVRGEQAVDAFSHEWPAGSGCNVQVLSTTSEGAGNVVPTPDLETADTLATTLPAQWILGVGTIGTTLKLTSVEIQTVIMSGTPTAGFYVLKHTTKAGKVYATAPLSYAATGSDVQAALRLLPGLEDITVVTTGSSPNYTHTITFTGVPNPGQLTSVDTTTGGTHAIAHNTTTAGSAFSVRGARALEFDATGAEQTTVYVPVVLEASTQYAFSMFAAVDVVPAAGVVTVDLIDGISGTVLADDAGTSNTLGITASALLTTHELQTAVFRTPSAMPAIVYLRIRQSTAISAGTSAFIDEVQLKPMTELYTGGLWVAAFTGLVEWEVADRVTIAVTNDRAGGFQEWLDRALDLRTQRVLLPSAGAGAETIVDSLIG